MFQPKPKITRFVCNPYVRLLLFNNYFHVTDIYLRQTLDLDLPLGLSVSPYYSKTIKVFKPV